MFNLTGKTALVTGATGGIGDAIARALHAQGANVAISGTRKDVLDKLAGEPLDVKVNGTLFAKAEVVVMNGSYGLRIVELSGVGLDALTQ